MIFLNSKASGRLSVRRTLFLALAFLGALSLAASVKAQQVTQPMVAIHDSELTRALTTMPAFGATPNDGTDTGFQWWETDWNYFVMPDSLKEALTSDGTAFTVIGDSNISSGLLLSNGLPKYPIVFSLAAAAIRSDEIAQLTNYVAAGGFLFVSGPAFTRDTNGVTLGDFAIANQMGIHMVAHNLLNYGNDSTLTRQFNHRLVSHLPDGKLTWRLPAYSEEINWGTDSNNHNYTNAHDVWQITASDSTVVAKGDTLPYITVKPYGKGYFIYEAAFNPIVSHGGFGPGMYSYVILRKAIEWAFESANMPVPKLSPWPYQYDAAFIMRHDLENYDHEMADIEQSAGVEFTNGVRGDYYMCTGTLRVDMNNLGYDTNAVVQSLRRAFDNYGATISTHNGGLKNANNTMLTNLSYDYYHWGTDEPLDVTPAGYPNGTAYATASLSNSFKDIESWLPGRMVPSMRTWVAPNFNGTREASYNMQAQLNVKIAGDQKISPFPHWTLSTQTPDKKYAILTEPVSEWFVNSNLAQSLEWWHPPGVQTSASLHTSVDFYYNLGTLVNFYSHTLTTGEGDAGPLTPDFMMYSINTNLHPRLWNTNGIGIYKWWLTRSNVQVNVSYSTNGYQSIATYSIKNATDPNTAVELLTPGTLGFCTLNVVTNGVVAGANGYRIVNNQLIRVKVGASVTNVVISYYLQGLGALVYSENFDGVSTPSLPSGWTASASGGESAWITKTSINDSAPNAISVPDPTNSGVSTIVSPPVVLPSGPSQLSFRNNYNLEPGVGGSGYDGGVLEIKIGTNAFVDVLTAGGNFVMGGYTGSLVTNTGNALGDRPAWSGNSGGFITTVLNLPASAAGKTNQFRWICSVDSSNGPGSFTGWQIDTVAITNLTCLTCGGGANPPVLVQPGPGDVTVNEGLPIIVTNTATDADGSLNTLTYVLTAPSTNAHIDLNGVITWTPGEADGPSTNTFTTVVTDCTGLSSTNSFKVYVNEVNTAPSFPAPGQQTVNELGTLLVTNVATDSDIPANTLTYQLLSPPAHMTINTNTGVITFNPDESQGPNTYTITTVVTDNNPWAVNSQHLTTTNSFNVVVNEVNTAPFFTGLTQTNFTVNEGILLTVTNIAQDNDIPANTLTYALINPPLGASISNGIFTWIPSGTQGPSTNIIQTVVTDNSPSAVNSQHLSATNFFQVIVNDTESCQYASFFQQNFDGTNAPALPTGWTSSVSQVGSNWVTTTVSNNTSPNAAFVADAVNVGTSLLISPVIAMPSGQAMLSFKNNYNLEINATNANDGYDGGVLEIKIGNGAFTDIITAGGSFVTGGYNAVIDSQYSNPLAGRQAWSGNSHGYITTTVSLPSAAASTNIQLRWNCGSDNGNVFVGWWIDTITMSNLVCTSGPQLPIQNPVTIGEFSTLRVTNTATEAGSPPPIFTYQLLSPPGTAAIDTNGIITWSPNQTNSPGTYTISTLVTDNSLPTNQVASNSFLVTVNEVNIAPTPATPGPQTVNELAPLSVNNAATETNIHSTTTGYTLVNGLFGMNVTSNGLFTWTPQQTQSPTNVTVTIVVTNNNPFDTVNPILKATNSFTVAVKEVNVAPTLPNIGLQTINELTPLSVNCAATETNVHSVTTGYGLISPLSGMSINTNTGVFTWTPQQNQSPSTNLVTVVVTNNNPFDTNNPVLTATTSFNVIVKEVNVAPTLPNIGLQTINELTPLSVNCAATETNVHSVTTGYGLIGPLSGMSINTNTGVFTWTPQQNQSPSTNLVTVVVTNNNPFDTNNPILTATTSFNVIVKEVNIAPTLPNIGLQTVNELSPLSVNCAATETNIHSVTTGYGLISPLSGMSINTNTGVFTWTPQQNQSPSTNLVTVVVTNNNPFDTNNPILTATTSFNVIVKEVNIAPTLPNIGLQTVNELSPLSVNCAATETNIHSVTTGYGLISPLSGMSINTNTGVFTWTPQQNQSPSTNLVTVVVTNNNPFDTNNPVLTATTSFNVIVREVNVAPTLPNIGLQTVNESTLLSVNCAATETNIHSVTTGYGLISPLSGMGINTNTGVFTWTPQQDQSPSTNLVTVVVTNNNPFDTNNPILMATTSFNVIVREVNIAPVLPFISQQTITVVDTLTVTNTATEPNIHATTIGYGLISPPYGVVISGSGIITWSPGTNLAGTTNLITTVVTNSDVFDTVNPQLVTTNSFKVVVNGIHNGPSLRQNMNGVTINNLTSLIVTNTATDNDVPFNGLSYQLINPPGGATIGSSGIISWAPTSGQCPSTNLITTVVTDGDIVPLKATNSFNVYVNPVTPPTILSIGVTNAIATVTWSATVGHTYRLQFENPGDTDWTEVPVDITVTNGTTGSTTNGCGSVTQFYRVTDTRVTVSQ